METPQEPAVTAIGPATHQGSARKTVNFGELPWCEHLKRPVIEDAEDGQLWECPDGCGTHWKYILAVELWVRIN